LVQAGSFSFALFFQLQKKKKKKKEEQFLMIFIQYKRAREIIIKNVPDVIT
jgi:hypothetical protein